MPGGRPRKQLSDDLRSLLGVEPDTVVAKKAGVHVDTITAERKRLGIPAAKRGAGRKVERVSAAPDGKSATPTPTATRWTPPTEEAVLELHPIAYLELQLRELRDAERMASGVALASLKKQERQVWAELEVARKTERDRVLSEAKKKAGPDDILSQRIIPRALKMSRAHREQLYSALGASLGVGAELEQDSVEP